MIPLEKTASILNGNYKIRLEPVQKCGDVAWSLGFKMFALQDGGQCFGTSSLEKLSNSIVLDKLPDAAISSEICVISRHNVILFIF